ncbi:hypothetical protein OG594_44010 [Streptomyces sp. NBC_01214]|uniref:hypothetical protein n=1 Tax=Streptomyces sp. NBC_01214 TaxID=2903777 RepID=UPI002259B2A7|nr:hypothetical protein [Streptomyces sp. NBC_01214]MCX4808476.1 hypothetical protein [Streptomyces sp. NBC_01214]
MSAMCVSYVSYVSYVMDSVGFCLAPLGDAAPERVARTRCLTDAVAELADGTADQRRVPVAIGAPPASRPR